MRQTGFCGLLAVLFLLPAAPAVAGSAPALTFSDQGVAGSGFSPGGQVVWFGLTKDVVAYEVTFTRVQQVAAVDGTGQTVFDLGRPLPQRSLWAAVDLTSGAYVIATPPGFPLVETALPAAALASGPLGDQLTDAVDSSEILLVRPGQGVWGATVGRGGDLDESLPTDPGLKISLAQLAPILTSDPVPPQKVTANDLLVLFHPDTMSAAVVLVGVQP